MEDDMQKINTAQIIGWVGCLLLAGGTFLPFAGVFGFNVNYIEGDGIFVVGLAILATVLFFLRQYTFAGIAVLLSGALCIYSATNLLTSEVSGLVQLQFGVFVILLGVVVGAIGSVMGSRSKKRAS
jgi:uncharacterized membrane protein YGL010W